MGEAKNIFLCDQPGAQLLPALHIYVLSSLAVIQKHLWVSVQMPREKSFHTHICTAEISKSLQITGEQARELLYFYHRT